MVADSRWPFGMYTGLWWHPTAFKGNALTYIPPSQLVPSYPPSHIHHTHQNGPLIPAPQTGHLIFNLSATSQPPGWSPHIHPLTYTPLTQMVPSFPPSHLDPIVNGKFGIWTRGVAPADLIWAKKWFSNLNIEKCVRNCSPL